jgi:DNA-binding SARP family transcriptional activator
MDFQMLGPVELKAHDGRVDLGPLKQRTVLAALLFDAGRPVTQELLISRVWDGCPPAEVRNTLYTYVARLRRILASVPGAEGARLVRRSGGYLLDVDPATVDAHRFTRLAADTRATGISEEQRYALANRALAEFAAVPLTDLTCQWAGRVRETLLRRQRDMLRLHATLAIRLGHAVLVVDRLYGVMLEEPLAEELASILMSALYFSGRSAEALEFFARTRAALAAELGVEPGPELCRTHEEILRAELTRPALGALTERPSCLAQPGQRPGSFGSGPPAVPAGVTAGGRRCGPSCAPPAAARRAQSPIGRRSPWPATRHVQRGPGQARPGLPRGG